MTIQIDRYKVTVWGDRSTAERFYGVKVHVVGQGWMNCAQDSRAVLLHTRKDANAYIAHMKSERNEQGFKMILPPGDSRILPVPRLA